MDKDTVIRLAREARLGAVLCHNSIDGDRVWIEGADWHDELERFADLVAAHEREECAKVCDETVSHHYIKQLIPAKDEAMLLAACADCAAAIRNRKD